MTIQDGLTEAQPAQLSLLTFLMKTYGLIWLSVMNAYCSLRFSGGFTQRYDKMLIVSFLYVLEQKEDGIYACFFFIFLNFIIIIVKLIFFPIDIFNFRQFLDELLMMVFEYILCFLENIVNLLDLGVSCRLFILQNVIDIKIYHVVIERLSNLVDILRQGNFIFRDI